MATLREIRHVPRYAFDGNPNFHCRRSFGSVLDVVPLADTVTKLTARCELCGKRAFFTFRKTTAKQTELIAGADVYMPVCRQHYVNGQVVIETANNALECRKTQSESRLEAAVEATVAI